MSDYAITTYYNELESAMRQATEEEIKSSKKVSLP
jgi:hypothetical protein